MTRFVAAIIFTLLLPASALPQVKQGTIHLRRFEKNFSRIPPGVSGTDGKKTETITVYMYRYEVSNELYRVFLHHLAMRNQDKTAETAAVNPTGWAMLNPGLSVLDSTYFFNEAFDHYPVVNISRAGALLFCEWLTQWYNSQPNRSFKDRKVHFQLPTAEIWEAAARGGIQDAVYPWGYPSLRGGKHNDAQCNYRQIGDENLYVTPSGNISVISDPKKKVYINNIIHPQSDNADFTAPVNAYTPNPFGLYNMSGNVAEMVLEAGVTKGGSWNNTGYEVRIDGPDPYNGFTGSSPCIGFRMIMVVEEK